MAGCSTAGCKNKPRQNEALCAKCKKQSDSANNEHENIIVNEVLWYADQHRHAASKDSILKVMVCHFSLEDVNVAKTILVSKFGEHINAERKKSRKDSPNRSEKMKVCEDILGALFDLDDHISVTCVALEWKKTLKVSPEEVPDIMLAEKVIQMEARFKVFEDALSELSAKQLLMEENQSKPLLSDVVAGRSSNSPVTSVSATERGINVSQGAARPNRARLNSTPVVQSTEDNSEFSLPRSQRRRNDRLERQQREQSSHVQHYRARRRPIVGNAVSNSGLRATPMPNRDIFVYRVHKNDNADAMKNWITEKGVSVRDIELKSHDEAKYNSFKISVGVEDVDKLLEPGFWPVGIYVRRWRGDRSDGSRDTPSLAAAGSSTNEVNSVQQGHA